jgi:hypothetical protein
MRWLVLFLLACLGAPLWAQGPAQAPSPQGDAREASASGGADPAKGERYSLEEILVAADGAFGKGAQGLAQAIERTFKEHGEPTGYIVGREGSGAFVLGIRYGKGTLHSRIEGNRTVHWQGPSVGFDVGGDASTVFILVYDLHDSEEIFARYPAVEGRAYLVGGISLAYHQFERVRLVPVRLGAGWRLGANVGYLHFTKNRRILPL